MVAHSGIARPGLRRIGAATPELTWGLMIATVRDIAGQDRRMREACGRTSVGTDPGRQDAGAAGPGPDRQADGRVRQGVRHGGDRLEPEPHRRGRRGGRRRRVEKDELFAQADVVSIHLVLSDRTPRPGHRARTGADEATAYLINTSRGPIVVEADLIAALPAEPSPAPGSTCSTGTAAARPSAAVAGQRHADAAPRLRHLRDPDAFYGDSLEAVEASRTARRSGSTRRRADGRAG